MMAEEIKKDQIVEEEESKELSQEDLENVSGGAKARRVRVRDADEENKVLYKGRRG